MIRPNVAVRSPHSLQPPFRHVILMQPRELLLPLLRDAIAAIGAPPETPVVLDLPRNEHRGEIATGVAFRLAVKLHSSPSRVAERIVAAMRTDDRVIERIEIAGGGFINITFTSLFYQNQIEEILARPEQHGRSNGGAGTAVAVDVLANGSGRDDDRGGYRGAVIADAIARMLRWTGHTVTEPGGGDTGLRGDILTRLGIEPSRHTAGDDPEVDATLAELSDRGGRNGGAGNARRMIGGHGAPLTDGDEPTMLLRMIARCHRLLRHGTGRIVLVTDERDAAISRSIASALMHLGHPPASFRAVMHTGLPSCIDREAGLQATLDAIGPQATRLCMLRGGPHGELPGTHDRRWERTLRDPLYDIPYTHFTAGTMLRAAGRLAADRGDAPIDPAASLAPLTTPPERELMRKLMLLPWIIERGALDTEPRIIIEYLDDLAGATRRFYRTCRMIAEESGVRDARLRLLGTAHMALGNGLAALGIPPGESI